jgi:hypothetical protein
VVKRECRDTEEGVKGEVKKRMKEKKFKLK